MNNIRDLIIKCGGSTKFSKKFGVNVRTVESWKILKRVPSQWEIDLFAWAIEHSYDVTHKE